MENIAISSLMEIINSLSVESKLEVLSELSDSLKIDFRDNKPKPSKEKLLDELFGAWKDFPDGIEQEIIDLRNVSNREINFD